MQGHKISRWQGWNLNLRSTGQQARGLQQYCNDSPKHCLYPKYVVLFHFFYGHPSCNLITKFMFLWNVTIPLVALIFFFLRKNINGAFNLINTQSTCMFLTTLAFERFFINLINLFINQRIQQNISESCSVLWLTIRVNISGKLNLTSEESNLHSDGNATKTQTLRSL